MTLFLRGLLLTLLIVGSLFTGVRPLDWHLFTNADQQFIFFTTRIPRTVSLLIAGSTLGICGLVMQQLTQNRFVSPTTAGTMDSAKLGMLVVMLFFPQASPFWRYTIVFLFALLGTWLFIQLVHLIPSQNQMMLPLLGIMLGSMLGSCGTFLAYQFNLTQNMSSWLQGNFAVIMKNQYEFLYLALPLLVMLYVFATHLSVISLGEMTAKNLGLPFFFWQFLGLTLVALASSIVLITVGNIPFLGLIVPNLISFYCGDHLKKILGRTALLGSCLLLACDILARVLIKPYEIPVSLIIGVLGGLGFFILLLRRSKFA
jgi:iron complex transport system permease protein